MPIKTPSYYEYFGRTFKLVSTPDGGLQGWLLNLRTGEFEVDNRPIMKVLFATSDSDISSLTYDDFVDETEQWRAYELSGDGPIFAIYDTIDALYKQVRAEGRTFTPDESKLIKSLRHRTFTMWEEKFARGDRP